MRKDIIISTILIGILLAFLQPNAMLLMPNTVSTLLIIGMATSFLLFTSLVWRERVHDEREAIHRATSGWWSFLVGSVALVTAIIIQAIDHHIDPWLIIVLIIMLLTKLASRLHQQSHH